MHQLSTSAGELSIRATAAIYIVYGPNVPLSSEISRNIRVLFSGLWLHPLDGMLYLLADNAGDPAKQPVGRLSAHEWPPF